MARDRSATGDESADTAARKAILRERLLAARRGLDPQARAAAGHQLRDAVLGAPETEMAGVVAAYLSVGTEPDTRGLVYALWKRGTYVLLPLLRPGGDLDWPPTRARTRSRPAPTGCWSPPSGPAAWPPSPVLTWSSCRRWPLTGGDSGSAGAAAATTGHWPGSARPC